MLTRREHAELSARLDAFRKASVELEQALVSAPKSSCKIARMVRSDAWDKVEQYVTEIGPSKYEHPMLAKQQNDGLREKQGR